MKLTEEIILELYRLPTGNVADANGKRGNMDAAIKPVDPGCHMVGRAVTVECRPGDNLALHQGIYAAGPGDVVVYDCQGYTGGGHFGDIMATACKVRGLAGVVIDGSCRDSEDIKDLGFPVFARAYNPGGTIKEALARINVPVICGGVLVRPGDIIFGDCDGIVVVPKEKEDQVFERAKAIYEKEFKVKEMLLAGKSTMEIYGFDKLVEEKMKV